MSPARLTIVRLAFVLGCVLPTLFVLGWSFQHASPRFWAAQQVEWEEKLAQQLGLSVQIEKVAYPSVYVARLYGVKLVDPETKAEIAQIRSLEIWHDDEGWKLELSQPEILLRQFPAAWKQLQESLFRRSAGGVACEVTAGELTLKGEADSQTLVEFQASWLPGEQHASLRLKGQLAGAAVKKPLALTITRDRQTNPPLTRWQFDTSSVAVPCLPLADDLPFLAILGKDCKFTGQADVQLNDRGWQGELHGKFQPVDLPQLFSGLPHKLTGQAEVTLEHAQIVDGRIQQFRGTVESKGGYVSRSLLEAATKYLAMQEEGVRPASTHVGGAVPYRRMAFGFQLGPEGLTLRGGSDPTRDGVLIAAATGPILLEPAERLTPVMNLLHALGSSSDGHTLASAPLESLRRLLPLPHATLDAASPGVRLSPSESRGQAIKEPGTGR